MHLRHRAAGLPFSLMSSQHLGLSPLAHEKVSSFLPSRWLGQAGIRCQVNMASGNVCVQDRPLVLPDINTNIVMSFIYNSLDSQWRFETGPTLHSVKNNDSLMMTEVDGREITFHYDAEKKSYTADECVDGKSHIQFDETLKTFTCFYPQSRRTEIFNLQGKLVKRIDELGNETIFEYGQDHLSAIIAPSGMRYEIRKTAENIAIYAVNDETVLLHTYELDNNGNLKTSKTPGGYEVTYQYQDGKLDTIQQTDGTLLSFAYDNHKIQSVQSGDDANKRHVFHYENNTTTFTHENGAQGQLHFNEKNQPLSFSFEDETCQYQINEANQLEKITYTDASEESFTYDDKTGLLLSHKERNGKMTRFYYSNDDKPILTAKAQFIGNKTEPSSIHRYVYDTAFHQEHAVLRFEISATGRVKEHEVNEHGLVEKEREYLSDYFTCSNDPTSVPSLNDMQHWKDTLKEKESLTHTALTQFDYDQQGRVVSVKAFADIDPDGNGIDNAAVRKTLFKHDVFGHITEKEIKSSEKSFLLVENKIDELGRCTKEVIGKNSSDAQTTHYDYTQNQIIKTNPSGRVETRTMNAEGRLQTETASEKAGLPPSRVYHYENSDRVEIITLPDHQKTLRFYDYQDRLVAQVSASGYVTQIDYHADKRYHVQTDYAQAIKMETLLNNATFSALTSLLEPKKEAENDRKTYQFFDLQDSLQYSIDAEGFLTEYQYEPLSGKVSHTILYKEKISEIELQNLCGKKTLARVPSRLTDTIHSTFYDSDGDILAEQDPAGYLTHYLRDGAGNTTKKRHYLIPNELFTNQVSDLHLSDTDKKSHDQYYFYNSLQQCTLEIDARGFIKSHTYFADGKKAATTSFANKVSADWYNDTAKKPGPSINTEKDETTQFEYDALGRLKKTHLPNASVIKKAYDNMDHVTSKYRQDELHQGSEGDHCRGAASRYDVWGQENAHANAFVSQVLTDIDLQPLSPKEKEKAKEKIWQEQSERHTYDAAGLKIKTTDALGHSVFYYYDQENRLAFTVDATGAVMGHQHNVFGEVIQEDHYYERLPKETLHQLTGGRVSDAFTTLLKPHQQDRTTTFKRDKRGQIIQKTDANGNVSRFHYDACKRCTLEEIPVNDAVPDVLIAHHYEARGLETTTIHSTRNEQDKVVHKKYEHYLGKETDCLDEVNTHSQCVYDETGHLIETKIVLTDTESVSLQQVEYDAFSRPVKKTNADDVTTFIDYDVKQRQKTITHGQDKTAKIISQENSFGEPITSTVLQDTNILHQETWQHAPDGQMKTYTKGTHVQSVNHFNLLGLKEKEIHADQTSTCYERNEANQLTSITQQNKEETISLSTTFTPNPFGEQETVVDARGMTTNNTFDKSGRLQQSVLDAGEEKDNLNIHTIHLYNAQGGEIFRLIGDEQDSLLVKQERDGFNNVTSTITDPKNIALCTDTTRDAKGRVVKEKSPGGHVTRTYFDKLEKKRFVIKELNETECSAISYEYTHAGKIKSLRTHAIPLKKDAIKDETTLDEVATLFKQHETDTVTDYFYDEKGREVFKLKRLSKNEKDTQAIVTETTWDAADRKTSVTHYATPILLDNTSTWTTALVREKVVKYPKKDQAVHQYYDEASQLRLTIDQDGAAVEKRYDEAGREITDIHYANTVKKISSVLLENLNQLTPSPSDRIHTQFYDALGRLQFSVDANQTVTRFDYDENNNVIQTCQFKDKAPSAENHEALAQQLKALTIDEKKDTVTKTEFDHANRKVTVTDALGHKDHFTWNALGKMKTRTTRSGHVHEYGYDSAYRLTEKISPETTVTEIQMQNGHLQSFDKKMKVTKRYQLDKDNNAVAIIEGADLPEERSVHFSFDANHNPTGTTIDNVSINDETKPADLLHLPRLEKTLNTKMIYNTKGHKIAEQNEAGTWSYYLYDALERLVYEVQKEKAVIGYTYNSFNQKEMVKRYATPCTLDLTHYRETGEANLSFFAAYPETPEDRVTTFEYDAAGQEINVKKGEVLYYDNGQMGMAQPETKKSYTTFGDCFYEAVLISLGKWAENYKWFDHQGNVLAEVNENRYLVRYERDGKGNVTQKTEYAQALTLPLSEDSAKNLSIADLDKHITADPKDRITVYEYDVLGQKIKEKKLKVIRQDVTFNAQHVPDMNDKPAADEETSWTYTPTQKLAVTTHPTGEKEHHYYDERDLLIGKTKPTFTQVHEEGAPKVTPLTVYKVNAFGQTVVKQEAPKGCVLREDNVLPAFAGEIYEEISQFDNRGALEAKQNAENHLTVFIYTKTKKIARQLEPGLSWAPKAALSQEMEEDFYVVPREALENEWADVDKNPDVPTDTISVEPPPPTFIQLPHVDEQQIEYDAFDRPIQLSYCRDGQVEETTHSRYTIFGDFEAEGPDGKNWPLQRKVDVNGHGYYTNAEKGAPTFQLHDLRNLETLRLQASQQDLSQVAYPDIPALLQQNAKDIERTETIHDAAGNVMTKKFPVWFRDKNALPSRHYEVDHWHNVVKEIDSLGHETDSEFNHQNQLIRHTQPETDVLDEHGVLHRERPETHYGYNARGFHIATKNADGHTEAHLVDELGHPVTHVLPDGITKTKNTPDALGRNVRIRDARDKLWSQQYDRMGNITETFFPSGNAIIKTYDGKKGLSSVTDSAGFTLRYNNDVRGHVCLTFYPLGHVVHHLCDRNGLPNKIWRSGEEPLLWIRDYFGHPYWHQDLGDHIEHSTYDYKMQLFTVKRDNGAPSPSMSYTEKCDNKDSVCPVIYYKAAFLKTHSVKDLTYNYAYGHLEYKTDKGLSTQTHHKVDSEGRCEEIAISDLTTSTLLNKRQTQFDEVGRESYTTHAHMTGEKKLGLFSSQTKYDVLDNRRLVHSELAPVGYADCCIPPVIKRDDWFTYDAASRVKILNGVLKNGMIQADAHSIAFDYALDLRTGETSVHTSSSSNPMLVTLTHNEDGLLKESVSPSPLHLHAAFEYKVGWINKVTESSPLGRKVSTATQDKNGWMGTLTVDLTINYDKTHKKNYTLNEYPGCSEQPDRTRTTTTDLNKKNEIIARECNVIDYLKFDTKIPTAVTTTSWQIHVGQTINRAEQGLDANGNINGKHYSLDETPNSNVYLENTSDGLVLFKQGFNANRNITQYHFLYNTQDEAKALYYINYNYNKANDHATSLKNHHHHIPTVPEIPDSDLVIRTPVMRAGKLAIKLYSGEKTTLPNCNDPHYAEMGPQFYTVAAGDTLEKIAVSIYGDVEAAETLARFNGLLSMEHSLRAGHVLKLPPYMGSHNKANIARPYNQLKAIILGHLSTYIVFPQPKKPHQDIFGNLVKLIALAVIIYTAPILAGHLLGSAALLGTAGTAATLSSTDIIVTAMVAALEDAVVQGVAIGVGIQQSKFSFAEALETGITAGLGLTLGAKTMEEIAHSALKIGTTATATQLIEMKAGLRDKFDARGVALQVSAYLASAGINKVMGNSANHMNAAAKNVVSTGTNAVLGHAITGAPLSLQNIAANAIGSTVGDELGEELAESLSTPPRSSRPATRSAAARKQQQRQPSHHEQEEERLDFELDDPVLPISDYRYGEASYGLSEMNRERIQPNPAFYTEDGMVFGSDAYVMGRLGINQPASITPRAQYDYAEGRAISIGQTIASVEMGIIDGALAVKGLYSAAKLRFFSEARVGVENLIGSPRELIIAEAKLRTAYLHSKYGVFTKHGIDRVIERGVQPSDLLDAIRNPLRIEPVEYDAFGRPAQVIIGKSATYVVNPETRGIVTSYSTKPKLANKLIRELEEAKRNEFKL